MSGEPSKSGGAMWGGRFERAPEAEFYAFQRSFDFDRRLLPYELAIDRAWARGLAAAELIDGNELAQILGGLDAISLKAQAEPQWLAQSGAEDVHSFVEQELIARIGAAGAKLHTGRSRNDLAVTGFRMFVREAAGKQLLALADLVRALIESGERNIAVPMPGNTHMQRAQPILWAHLMHAHAEQFFEDGARLRAAAASAASACPMGAGALAGCSFPIGRGAIARELKFARESANSLTVTSDRAFALDFLFALSVTAVHLSRLAADFSLFATQEFGFLVLPDEYSTGSSLMPQKKNPDVWELIRGKAGRVTAALFALCTTMKGLPTGYQRDLQEDKEPLFDAHDQTLAMLRVAAGAVRATRLNEARMREAAADPALLATEMADYLVTKGVPFRQAHEITGAIVREAENRGQSWHTFPLATLQEFSPAFAEDLHSWLTLDSALARRNITGGTAPARVQEALAAARRRISELEDPV